MKKKLTVYLLVCTLLLSSLLTVSGLPVQAAEQPTDGGEEKLIYVLGTDSVIAWREDDGKTWQGDRTGVWSSSGSYAIKPNQTYTRQSEKFEAVFDAIPALNKYKNVEKELVKVSPYRDFMKENPNFNFNDFIGWNVKDGQQVFEEDYLWHSVTNLSYGECKDLTCNNITAYFQLEPDSGTSDPDFASSNTPQPIDLKGFLTELDRELTKRELSHDNKSDWQGNYKKYANSVKAINDDFISVRYPQLRNLAFPDPANPSKTARFIVEYNENANTITLPSAIENLRKSGSFSEGSRGWIWYMPRVMVFKVKEPNLANLKISQFSYPQSVFQDNTFSINFAVANEGQTDAENIPYVITVDLH